MNCPDPFWVGVSIGAAFWIGGIAGVYMEKRLHRRSVAVAELSLKKAKAWEEYQNAIKDEAAR